MSAIFIKIESYLKYSCTCRLHASITSIGNDFAPKNLLSPDLGLKEGNPCLTENTFLLRLEQFQ